MWKKLALLSGAVVLALGLGTTAYFALTTVSGREMSSCCVENSAVGSRAFAPKGTAVLSQMDPYYYYRPFLSSDQTKEQELHIFQNVPLFGLDIGRYRLEPLLQQNSSGTIGTAILEVRTRQKTGQSVLLFYSSNPDQIASYEIDLQYNGTNITVSGSLPPGDPLLAGVLLGPKGWGSFQSARFYDGEHRFVEELEVLSDTVTQSLRGEDVVAVYGDNTVTMAMVDRQRKLQERPSPNREILDDLLKTILFREEAQARGLRVSQEEIAAFLASQEAPQADVTDLLLNDKLDAQLAQEYCKAHDLPYDGSDLSPEVQEAVRQEKEALFSARQGEIQYYMQ